MADKSAIEWTEATWNPVVGCTIVSPGCTNCYAMKMAARIERMRGAPHYAGTTQGSKAGAVWTGRLALAPDRILTQPLRWSRGRTIFVNSMGDLFHQDVPDEWIDRVFAVMALAPQHTFQVLTKRSARMRDYLGVRAGDWTTVWPDANPPGSLPISRHEQRLAMRGAGWPDAILRPVFPLPNVWLGISAERQQEADDRIHDLLATPAAVRFVSAEPLLGPIDFRYLQPGDPPVEIDALAGTHGVHRPHRGISARLDWIIVGGESGPSARPMHPDWARAIRDQCAAAGVPFFFKQWGEWLFEDQVEDGQHPGSSFFDAKGSPMDLPPPFGPAAGRRWHWWPPANHASIRIGKKVAGRLLDGLEHNAMPEPLL